MAKLTRFQRSQKAHSRLFIKFAEKSIGNPVANAKSEYHFQIKKIQAKAKRILPIRDRKIVYAYNLHDTTGKNVLGRKVSRKEYLALMDKYEIKSWD